MSNDITAKEAIRLLQENKKFILLDVRSDDEWREMNIESSIHMSIHKNDFFDRIDSLDKNKRYMVFCKSGGRAKRAQQEMEKKGFEVICVFGDLVKVFSDTSHQ